MVCFSKFRTKDTLVKGGKAITALAVMMSITGCATVVRGTKDEVKFVTSPAGASVVTNVGPGCQSTPCGFKIPRKEKVTATISKSGCTPQTVALRYKISGGGAGGLAGNVLAGGLVGVGVDALTGAAYDYYPNPVNVNLSCHAVQGSSAPALETGDAPLQP